LAGSRLKLADSRLDFIHARLEFPGSALRPGCIELNLPVVNLSLSVVATSLPEDALEFAVQMKACLGDFLRATLSGATLLAPRVKEFLKVAICAPVVQCYGLIETCAGSFIALPIADFFLPTLDSGLPGDSNVH
jgi:hypothetical protein